MNTHSANLASSFLNFALNVATGCHSPTTLDPWLCVPAFQQVCPIFSFAARFILTDFFLYCKNNFTYQFKRGMTLRAMPPEIIFLMKLTDSLVQRAVCLACAEVLSLFVHTECVPCCRTEDLLFRNIVHTYRDS